MVRGFWPESGPQIQWRLIAQTLVLYLVLLVPVLWLARRISRPLRALTLDARRFSLDGNAAPVPEEGPADVRAVIAAYNAGPARIARLRADTKKRGFDPNVWFGNVEYLAAEKIGSETVSYVSNIYKYYIAYRLIVDEMARKQLATAAAKNPALPPATATPAVPAAAATPASQ